MVGEGRNNFIIAYNDERPPDTESVEDEITS